MVARSALVRPAVGSSSRMSRGSSARTMASSSACFRPCDRRPAGEAIRSMRPVSRRIRRSPPAAREEAPSRAARRFGGRASEPQALGDGQALEDACDLKFAADAERHNAVRRQAPDRLARDLDHALERFGAIAETTDQGRLARAIRADNADEFARWISRLMFSSTERLPKDRARPETFRSVA